MASETTNYRQYLRDMVRIYGFYDQGKFDSVEADELRDAMEAPWYGLSQHEQTRIRGLALDLNSIRDSKRNAVETDERGRAKLIAATELKKRGELDEALDLVRASKDVIEPASVSFLRGQIWTEFNVDEVAAEFLRDAWQIENRKRPFLTTYLQVLSRVNLDEANRIASAAIAASDGMITFGDPKLRTPA